jgi:hypothetical protein
MGPSSRHLFRIPETTGVNFVKLNMYPDGGIVRCLFLALVHNLGLLDRRALGFTGMLSPSTRRTRRRPSTSHTCLRAGAWNSRPTNTLVLVRILFFRDVGRTWAMGGKRSGVGRRAIKTGRSLNCRSPHVVPFDLAHEKLKRSARRA